MSIRINDLPIWIQAAGTESWVLRPPEELIRAEPDLRATGAQCLKYSRMVGDGYDEIGFRFNAIQPYRNVGPTSVATRREAQLAEIERSTEHGKERTRANNEEVDLLAHRPLDLRYTGQLRYERTAGDLIRLYDDSSDSDGTTYIFSTGCPPSSLLELAIEQDESQCVTPYISAHFPGAVWISLSGVFRAGGFKSFEAISHSSFDPGNFYIFLSHRWREPSHPDISGEEAELVCNQIFGAICMAVEVASIRGLHRRRLYSPALNCPVGIHGTDFAENLIVNLLRPHYSTSVLEAVRQEVQSLLLQYGTNVVGLAEKALAITDLRLAVESRPHLSRICKRVMIWYDFSCIPQSGSVGSDELIKRALTDLQSIQLTGINCVVLDDPIDYFSRAWCTLESVVAHSIGGSCYLLAGTANARASHRTQETIFSRLFQDKGYILWRALLDTEVFQLQNREICMRRLGLDATKSSDLNAIYEQMRNLPGPKGFRGAPSELVTGTIPLPLDEGGQAIFCWGGRRPSSQDNSTIEGSVGLEWGDALSLQGGRLCPGLADASSSMKMISKGASGTAHVAILASCEGEAILIDRWLRPRLPDLEARTGAVIASRSWTAIDIAPIGKLLEARLRFQTIASDIWIFLALKVRFTYCGLTRNLIKSAFACGKIVYTIDLDTTCLALRSELDDADSTERITFHRDTEFPNYDGGLFRDQVPVKMRVLHAGSA
jgi:hypothetical protein